MKLSHLSIAVAAGLLAGNAMAFSLGGYQGPIKIKYSNWENLSVTSCLTDPTNGCSDGVEDNYGVVSITNIVSDDGLNTLLWNSGDNGEFLSGVFYGLDVYSASVSGGDLNVQLTGGFLDIYLNNAGFNANLGTGGYIADADGIAHNDYTGITTGSLFLALAIASGIDPLDGNVTIDANFDGATVPGSGDGAFFLDVLGGSHASLFDTDGFTTAFGDRDLFAQNDFCDNGALGCPGVPGATQGNWDLLSEDPVRGVVPEPASIALFGLGLVGLGLASRRRKA